MTENIYVPYHMVGRIIGKGSKTVLELEKITGCDIKLTRASRIDEKGEVALTGSEGARKKAKEHIENLLYKESITVPAWAVGNILGRGGRAHRKLQNDTGCMW
jgi:predicted PilT family ATPase